MDRLKLIIRKIIFCFTFGDGIIDKFWLLGMTVFYTISIRIPKAYRHFGYDVDHITCTYNGKKINLYLRIEDISMLYEIWMQENYRLPIDIENDSLIIDIGAHIGMATLYFWSLYGDTHHYVCIEGANKNKKILEKNLQQISHTTLVHNVITSNGRHVYFDESKDGHLVRISHLTGESRRSKTIEDIIRENAIGKIALCKMDIEGAEREILSYDPKWLSSVDHFILELHKGYKEQDLVSDLATVGLKRQYLTDSNLYWFTNL